MDLFRRNLGALAAKNPALARKVAEGVESSVDVREVPMRSGAGSGFEIRWGDRRALLYSLYDPDQEARELVEPVDFFRARIVVLLGLGGGHVLRELLRRIHPVGMVVVVESQLPVLRAVLRTRPLWDELGDRRVVVVDACDPDHLRADLEDVSNALITKLVGVDFVVTPAYARLWPEECRRIRELFVDAAVTQARAMGNSAHDTLVGIEQISENLHSIARAPSLGKLFGSLSGVPAICVASGPSLSKNVHRLRDAMGKAVIFCAESAADRLLAEGIQPDVVGVLERGEMVYREYFKDKSWPQRTVLAGQSVIWPEIFDTFCGLWTVVFKTSTVVERWIHSAVPTLATVEPGSSVANMNFALARALGCDPIVLVGQDLAYADDGKSHAEGVHGLGVHYARKGLHERDPEAATILGKDGRILRSTRWWRVFHGWFEREIPRTRAHVIDATEGGALIRAAEIRTLADVVEQYCVNPVQPDLYERLAREIPTDDEVFERINNLRRVFNQEMDRLEETLARLKQGREKLDEVRKAIRKGKQYGRIGNTQALINELGALVQSLPLQNFLFYFVAQSLFVHLGRRTQAMGHIDSWETAEAWEQIHEWFFDNLQQVHDLMRVLFFKGLAIVEVMADEWKKNGIPRPFPLMSVCS